MLIRRVGFDPAIADQFPERCHDAFAFDEALSGQLSVLLAVEVDVNDLELDAIKTKQLLGHLTSLEAAGKVLVVEDGKNEALELSARNVPDLVIIRSDSLNIVDVVDADAIVITKPSISTMSEVYA